MANRQLHTLVEGGDFFESPRWHDGRWWLSDFYRHLVLTVDPATGAEQPVLEVESQPSGLGWMPDGSLLVVSMKDHRLLRWDGSGEAALHADLSSWMTGHGNDMVVDAAGRAYVGNFGFDLMGMGEPRPADLVRVDPDGSVTVVAEDLLFPNGMVITPDGERLIVGESAGQRYTAFTIGDDGALRDREIWAQLAPTPEITTFAETIGALTVSPDGCCLDAEGRIWMADAMGARVLRVAEGGEILEELPAPEGLGFFACMLGGDDGRDLLLCSAPDFFEHNRAGARGAVLFTTRVEVPRAGLP